MDPKRLDLQTGEHHSVKGFCYRGINAHHAGGLADLHELPFD